MNLGLDKILADPRSATTADIRWAIEFGASALKLAPSVRNGVTSVSLETKGRTVTLDGGSRGRIEANIKALKDELRRRGVRP